MSNIEWTGETWNPLSGCSKVSAGCKHCYAETMARRLKAMGQAAYQDVVTDTGRWTGKIQLIPEKLTQPLRWRKPRTIFVNSMSDLFHEDVPFDYIDRVFAVMALCSQHTFQVLTKRPERMVEYLYTLYRRMGGPSSWFDHIPAEHRAQLAQKQIQWPLPNVWLGTSVENQNAADQRITHLLECPAAARFLSCEPLLGTVDIASGAGVTYWDDATAGIHWVIVGGELGPKARVCSVAWIRDIVQQCKAAGVPVFVKQLGSHGRAPLASRKGNDMNEWPEDLRVREMPK